MTPLQTWRPRRNPLPGGRGERTARAYRDVLAIPGARALIGGSAASQIGDWLYNAALLGRPSARRSPEARAPYQEAMNSLCSHAADSRVQRTSRPPRPPIPSCCQPPAFNNRLQGREPGEPGGTQFAQPGRS